MQVFSVWSSTNLYLNDNAIYKQQNFFIRINNLSILDEECVDTKSESQCKKMKKKGKCSKGAAQTSCRLTCGVCTPTGNIYIYIYIIVEGKILSV